MFTVILDEGIVIRDGDQKVVAPCQSDQDPDFCEYIAWVMVDGNEPLVLATRTQEN